MVRFKPFGFAVRKFCERLKDQDEALLGDERADAGA
jgi:hypothetical protein